MRADPLAYLSDDLRALTEYPNDDDIAVMASKCRLLWLAGTLGCTALVVHRDGFRVVIDRDVRRVAERHFDAFGSASASGEIVDDQFAAESDLGCSRFHLYVSK